MPELPEVETTRQGLIPLIVGESIVNIKVYNGNLRYPVPEELGSILNTQSLKTIDRRAKYLIFRFDQHQLVVHLGMSGSLVFVDKAESLRKHDHIEVEFSQGLLRYHDPRRFGSWRLFSEEDILPFDQLGPEPLSDEFNGDYLFHATRTVNSAIKIAIMDQKRVVGVGNIYASEALFNAGIQPERPAKSLSFAESQELTQAIKEILTSAIETGGTTLRDFRNPASQPGYFAQQLSVYNRAQQPCVNCGTSISKLVLGQRSTFYCEQCQR